jgi:hypothetical protein
LSSYIDIFWICFIIIRYFLSSFGETFYSDTNQGTDCSDEILCRLASELSNANNDNAVNSAFSISWVVVCKVTGKGISAPSMCLAIHVFPLFLSVTVMKNYTSFERLNTAVFCNRYSCWAWQLFYWSMGWALRTNSMAHSQ